MHPVDQNSDLGIVNDESHNSQFTILNSRLLERMAQKRHPTQVGAQTESLNQAIGQLAEAQQALMAAAEALAQTAAVMEAAATRPKRIEVLRGPDGRLEGATVV